MNYRHNLTNGIYSQTLLLPVCFQKIGEKTYYLFGIANALSIPIVWAFYPESNQRTLEEVSRSFYSFLLDRAPLIFVLRWIYSSLPRPSSIGKQRRISRDSRLRGRISLIRLPREISWSTRRKQSSTIRLFPLRRRKIERLSSAKR